MANAYIALAKSYSMKIPLLTYGMLLCIMLSSCEKQFELKMAKGADSTSGTGGTSTGVLLKVEGIGSKGTTTRHYEYDANGRLAKIAVENAESDGSTKVRRMVRDSLGRIVKVVANFKWGNLGNGATLNDHDSTVIYVHYPTVTATQFDYTLSSLTVQGVTTIDSSTYTYTDGRVTEMTTYLSLGGVMNVPTAKIAYSYDTNGNVTQLKTYMPDPSGSGSMSLILTFTFTVDDKISPLQIGNEALIEGGDGQATGKNNITRIAVDANAVLTSYPSQVTTIAYQYNAANKPVSGDFVNPVDGNKTLKYYYK